MAIRFEGSFSSIDRQRLSSAAGMSARNSESGGGGSVQIFTTNIGKLSASNGSAPVSIWKTITPSA
ncbi:hypothetical protein D3C83_291450 [compost metagenome]